jgi:large subunit ribosomal protein L18
MKEQKTKQIRIKRRAKRIRTKILARKTMPRLTVFRSNKFIYAQIIDDRVGKTIVESNEKEISDKMNKTQKANIVGKNIAKLASKKKIKEVVFDKGRYAYHGRVKALAEGAREGGLVF